MQICGPGLLVQQMPLFKKEGLLISVLEEFRIGVIDRHSGSVYLLFYISQALNVFCFGRIFALHGYFLKQRYFSSI